MSVMSMWMKAFAAVLLFSLPVYAARPHMIGWCQRGGQTIQVLGYNSSASTPVQASYPLATVTVTITGGGAATLYNNVGGSIANPTTCDFTGLYSFYVDDGTYDLQFSGVGIATPFTLGAIQAGTTEISGITIPAPAIADAVLTGSSATLSFWNPVANCSDVLGQHDNYSTVSHLWTCGTSADWLNLYHIPVFDVRAYANLAAAAAAAHATGGGILLLPLPGAYTVASNLTIYADTQVIAVPGATIAPAGGVTVTILGPLPDEDRQLFSGLGAVTIGAGSAVKAARAAWWGLDATGSTENSTQIQAALSSGPNTTAKKVILPSGIFKVTGTSGVPALTLGDPGYRTPLVTSSSVSTTLNVAIDAVETNIQLALALPVAPGEYITIGSETMFVSEGAGTANFKVIRGFGGTVPAAHLLGANVYKTTSGCSTTAGSRMVTCSGATFTAAMLYRAFWVGQGYDIVSIAKICTVNSTTQLTLDDAACDGAGTGVSFGAFTGQAGGVMGFSTGASTAPIYGSANGVTVEGTGSGSDGWNSGGTYNATVLRWGGTSAGINSAILSIAGPANSVVLSRVLLDCNNYVPAGLWIDALQYSRFPGVHIVNVAPPISPTQQYAHGLTLTEDSALQPTMNNDFSDLSIDSAMDDAQLMRSGSYDGWSGWIVMFNHFAKTEIGGTRRGVAIDHWVNGNDTFDGGRYIGGGTGNTTTLTSAVNNSTKTILVAAGTHVANKDYIRVESELMYVVSGGGTTTLTVDRGMHGYDLAAHASGAVVRIEPYLGMNCHYDNFVPNYQGGAGFVFAAVPVGGTIACSHALTMVLRDVDAGNAETYSQAWTLADSTLTGVGAVPGILVTDAAGRIWGRGPINSPLYYSTHTSSDDVFGDGVTVNLLQTFKKTYGGYVDMQMFTIPAGALSVLGTVMEIDAGGDFTTDGISPGYWQMQIGVDCTPAIPTTCAYILSTVPPFYLVLNTGVTGSWSLHTPVTTLATGTSGSLRAYSGTMSMQNTNYSAMTNVSAGYANLDLEAAHTIHLLVTFTSAVHGNRITLSNMYVKIMYPGAGQ